jgi:hypothetical protein
MPPSGSYSPSLSLGTGISAYWIFVCHFAGVSLHGNAGTIIQTFQKITKKDEKRKN